MAKSLYWVCGVSGILMLCGATANLIHIKRNSKAPFAYLLMTFTLAFGVYDIFAKVILQSYLKNGFPILSDVLNYVWYCLYLQSWEFAMKYLDSAMRSCAKPIISCQNVQRLRFTVEVLYICSMITLLLWKELTFPWNNQDVLVLINWSQTTGIRISKSSHWIWLILIFMSTTIIISSMIMLALQISRLK